MLEDYRYKHLYVRNSSPIKNVGYENGLVTRLRGKNKSVTVGCFK